MTQSASPGDVIAAPPAEDGNGRMATARELLSNLGLPTEDSIGLPDSRLTFDDGGHYRIEISGVERLSTLECLIDEARTRDIHVHRAVAFVSGATLLDTGELRAFAELAAENAIEVIAVPWPAGRLGPRASSRHARGQGRRRSRPRRGQSPLAVGGLSALLRVWPPRRPGVG